MLAQYELERTNRQAILDMTFYHVTQSSKDLVYLDIKKTEFSIIFVLLYNVFKISSAKGTIKWNQTRKMLCTY